MMHSDIDPSHKNILLSYIFAIKESTIGSPGRLRFHMALDEGSVSLRREAARLYRAQLAFSNILLEPTTV
jgi:hypothetical protein